MICFFPFLPQLRSVALTPLPFTSTRHSSGHDNLPGTSQWVHFSSYPTKTKPAILSTSPYPVTPLYLSITTYPHCICFLYLVLVFECFPCLCLCSSSLLSLSTLNITHASKILFNPSLPSELQRSCQIAS